MKKMIRLTSLSLALVLSVFFLPCAGMGLAAQKAIKTVPLAVNAGWVFDGLTEATPDIAFEFTLTKPGKVVVNAQAYMQCFVDVYTKDGVDVGDFSYMLYGSANKADNQSSTSYLYPGTYLIKFSDYFGRYGKVGASAVFTPLSTTEQEPNDTMAQAMPIQSGSKVTAMMASTDSVDAFKINEPHSTYFLLNLTTYFDEIRLSVFDKDFSELYSEDLELGGSEKKPVQTTIPLVLPKGACYFEFVQGYTSYGAYEFTLGPRKPAASASLPKTVKTAKGFSIQLPVSFKPANAEPPTFQWKSSKKSVGTVSADGKFKALKKGTTKVTGVNKAQKLSISGNVAVTDNVYKVSKPYKGKAKGLYFSTKQLRYKGDYLHVDLFIYNKTGVKIGSAEDMAILIYDMAEYDDSVWWEGLLYEIELGDWRPKGGVLRNNSHNVISAKVKTKGKKLNLPTGQYLATVGEYTYFYEKSPVAKGLSGRMVMEGEGFKPRSVTFR